MRLQAAPGRQLVPERALFRVPDAWHTATPASSALAAERSESQGRLIKGGILFSLAMLTFFDRFGLKLSDAYSIGPALIALYVLVGLIVASGAARLSINGALSYIAVFTVTAVSFLLTATDDERGFVSIGSLLLLLVLYAPLAVSLSKSVATPELFQWTMRWFVRFMLVIAVFGIVQFYAQFVLHAPWVFDWRLSIPAPIRGSGNYNTLNPAGELLKANGFFLREASGFSFMMAFALLCEMSFGKRKWAMAVFGLAVMLSYSGSGLLALGAAMLFQSGRKLLVQGVSAAVVATIVFSLFGDALHLSYTVDRLGEFDSSATKSSAYCRFIAPGKLAAEQINSGEWSALLGHGPGTTQKMFDVCETTYGKMTFEYGLLGAIVLSIMIVMAIGRSRLPIRLRVMLIIEWYLLGGNLLAPEPLLVIFFLSSMWPTRVGETLGAVPAAADPLPVAVPAGLAHPATGKRGLFTLQPKTAAGSRVFKLK